MLIIKVSTEVIENSKKNIADIDNFHISKRKIYWKI